MLSTLFGKGQKELKVLYILITLTLAAILLYPLGCVLFQSVLTKDGGLGFSNYTSLLSHQSFGPHWATASPSPASQLPLLQ